MSTSTTRNTVRTPRTRVITTPRQQLDIAVTVIHENEPSPAYLNLWRRLLAPVPAPLPPSTPPPPDREVAS